LPASGGSPPVVCRGGVRARRLSPCVVAPGAESGWSVVRGVDVGRRRRSPLVYGCGQPGGPSRSPLFPAVPRFGRVIGSRRRHRSWAISTSAFTRPESCVETLSTPVVEDLGTTRPAHRTLWTTLLVVRRSGPSPWWIESFPQPCEERPARVGFPAQVSCALLCPRRSKICGKWNFPRLRVVRNRGVPLVVHSGAFLARVVHRFRLSALWGCDSCCASSSDTGRAEAVVGGLGHGSG